MLKHLATILVLLSICLPGEAWACRPAEGHEEGFHCRSALPTNYIIPDGYDQDYYPDDYGPDYYDNLPYQIHLGALIGLLLVSLLSGLSLGVLIGLLAGVYIGKRRAKRRYENE